MDIVSFLGNKLGIDEAVARPVAGLILNYAKGKLGDTAFGAIGMLIPNAEELIKAAPSGGVMGAIGGMASSAFGGAGEKAGEIAGLAGGLNELGLDAGDAGKVGGAFMEFIDQEGGDEVKSAVAGLFD